VVEGQGSRWYRDELVDRSEILNDQRLTIRVGSQWDAHGKS
jgi:hypothetical protein